MVRKKEADLSGKNIIVKLGNMKRKIWQEIQFGYGYEPKSQKSAFNPDGFHIFKLKQTVAPSQLDPSCYELINNCHILYSIIGSS